MLSSAGRVAGEEGSNELSEGDVSSSWHHSIPGSKSHKRSEPHPSSALPANISPASEGRALSTALEAGGLSLCVEERERALLLLVAARAFPFRFEGRAISIVCEGRALSLRED